jgi:small-conductance mechanosensitive channel
LICALTLITVASAFAAENQVNAENTPNIEAVPVFPGVAEVIPRAVEVKQKMESARQTLQALSDLSAWEITLKERRTKEQGLNDLMKQTGDLSSQSFERLLRISGLLQAHKQNLEADMKNISAQTSELETMRKYWLERYTYWDNWRTDLKKQKVEYPQEEFKQVLSENKSLRENIVALNNRYIDLQQQFTRLLEANNMHEKQVEAALQQLRSTTFNRTAPSFFSAVFYQEFNAELFKQVVTEFSAIDWTITEELARGWWIVLLQILVLLFAVYIIRHYARTHRNDKQWGFLMAHPWASGIFISVVSFGFLFRTPSLILRFYLATLVVLSACVLVSGIILQKRHRILTWFLGGAYLTSLFLQVINLPQPLMRVFISVLSLVLLLLLARYCVLGRRNKEHWGVIASMRLGIVLSGVVLAAQIGGYSNLAARLVDASFKTVFLTLVTTMVLKLARGGVNFVIYHRKVQTLYFFRNFGIAFKNQVVGIIKILVLANAALALGQIWSGSSSIGQVWEKVAYFGFQLGSLNLDIVTLMRIVIIMYCAVVLSWFVRSMFDAGKIGPRHIDSGVRDSIKTLVHYFIIFCGVMFSLSTTGIGLQNFAVVAGALSIGIGFGLQNIVNNFISGIILLFERPIRKHDTIILDGEWAIVRNIGLRSTVVETFNKAELIVPNSDLISQKVTNLTHSNAQYRVVMNVGVAYGSDMEEVLRILEEEAASHPHAAKNPPPSAIFVGFGDSSLDFQLRIWLNNLDYCLSIFSEVGIAVYKRFAREGVEIPFPQQDLHVRSMDEKVVETWRGRVELHDHDRAETHVISE